MIGAKGTPVIKACVLRDENREPIVRPEIIANISQLGIADISCANSFVCVYPCPYCYITSIVNGRVIKVAHQL